MSLFLRFFQFPATTNFKQDRSNEPAKHDDGKKWSVKVFHHVQDEEIGELDDPDLDGFFRRYVECLMQSPDRVITPLLLNLVQRGVKDFGDARGLRDEAIIDIVLKSRFIRRIIGGFIVDPPEQDRAAAGSQLRDRFDAIPINRELAVRIKIVV